jgi:pimeloyl-ACP methyl ester carboxylesterase
MALTGAAGLAACGGGGRGGVDIGPGISTDASPAPLPAAGPSANPDAPPNTDPGVGDESPRNDSGEGQVSVIDRRIKVSNSPEVSLQVRDWQPPRSTGPVFVFLPGLGGNARSFDGLAPALAARSRVIAISRRGYGLSDKPLPEKTATQYYEVDMLVADLKAVLDALGVQRAVLGGHSIAGNELTRFAGLYPGRTQGLVYLDTAFDYTVNPDGASEDIPKNPLLEEPRPGPEDGRSLQAAIAFFRRNSKNWGLAQEANLRDSLDFHADGSVSLNTPSEVNDAMETAAHSYSPDYKAVRAPSLVMTALPAEPRDLFPWLELPLDAKTQKDVADYVRILRRAFIGNSDQLVAALKTTNRLTLDNASHGDFFMEREADVLRAIQFMTWA